MATRKAITKALAVQYRNASKELKGEILDTVCGLTGYHRDYARRALRAALSRARWLFGPPRTAKYDPGVVAALGKCWAVLNAPAGKRLAPMLAELVPLLRRYGELDLDDATAALLVGMSAATIDRKLAPARAKMLPRGRSPHQAGVDAEVEDRDADLGRSRRGRPGVRRGRPGRPRGRQRRRPVLLHLDRDRHRDRVDREPDRAGQGRQVHVVAAITEVVDGHAVPGPRDRLRQRRGVHQRPAVPVLPRAQAEVHPVPGRATATTARTWSRRTGPTVRQLVGYLRYDTPGGAVAAEQDLGVAVDARQPLLPPAEADLQGPRRREDHQEVRPSHHALRPGDGPRRRQAVCAGGA